MAYFVAVTLGFVLCLGMVGGIFVYSLKLGLNSNDSTKVDSL